MEATDYNTCVLDRLDGSETIKGAPLSDHNYTIWLEWLRDTALERAHEFGFDHNSDRDPVKEPYVTARGDVWGIDCTFEVHPDNVCICFFHPHGGCYMHVGLISTAYSRIWEAYQDIRGGRRENPATRWLPEVEHMVCAQILRERPTNVGWVKA